VELHPLLCVRKQVCLHITIILYNLEINLAHPYHYATCLPS
jgi:hypothetical protein